MKRPPGLWILLSAGVLWISLQNVYGLRATSLIFAKTSTTTTSTTEQPDDESATTDPPQASGPVLTGNPQIDYVYDPNLPKELNGFNLSDYPFYERVPAEEIDFKCDGLHDGFYASVKHKCQVYHHCLFGTRYDFLCGNYTAFDQKTFICHFASEIDCANSKKYWHRNDDLYKAATTSTVKPVVIYTPPPQPLVITSLPSIPVVAPSAPRRPLGGQRRPFRRRRPQYDYYEDEYYDDYYDERPRTRGRNRPRVRPRPLYEDYDEEYEDERYETRGSGHRNVKKRPYDRRYSGPRRNRDRIRNDYEDDVRSSEEEEIRFSSRRKPTDRWRIKDESLEDGYATKRKPNQRRPSNHNGDDRKLKRPSQDDYLDQDDYVDKVHPTKNREVKNKSSQETRLIIKPVSGTIYDRPRVAPKIKPPVPKHEADKYAYKPLKEAVVSKEIKNSSEYYDDYDEEPRNIRKPNPETRSSNRNKNTHKNSNKHHQIERLKPNSHHRPDFDDYVEYEDDISRDTNIKEHKPQASTATSSTTISARPTTTATVMTTTTSTTPPTTTSTTTTTELPFERVKEPLIRLVKRPFLPSRGGDPYAARGIQPVGVLALNGTSEKNSELPVIKEKYFKGEEAPTEDSVEIETENESMFKPSPILIKMPVHPSIPSTGTISEVQLQTRTNVNQHYQTSKDNSGPQTTLLPKFLERNPLDISADEYDVTLNDALNPTLPNLPVRAYPTGFNSGKDYNYDNFQQPNYNTDQMVAPANPDYAYQNKPKQRYIYNERPRIDERESFVHSSADFKGQYSAIREYIVPRQTQQTHAFYSRY